MIREIARRLFTIGIRPGLRSTQKRDVVFTNEVAFFLITTSIVLSLTDLGFGHTERSLVDILVAILLLPVFFLQARLRYIAAKVVAIFVPATMAVVSTLAFGFAANAHFFILATFVLSLVLFQAFRQHLLSLAWHGLLFFGLLLLENNWAAPIPGQDPHWMGIVNMALVTICIFVTLREYAVVFQGFESKVIHLVDSVREKNEALQAQTAYIEEQRLALQQSNLELQKLVLEHQHTEKLLRTSNQELEHFAYMASHDLKEPLRTVGSFASLIRRRLTGHLNEELSEYLGFVTDGVNRMSSLLDDVLALSRLKNVVEHTPVDLNLVLRSVEMNLQAKLADHSGEITAPTLPEIFANRAHLCQLFQNLIANALKFHRGLPPKINISFEDRGKQFLFKITDNGVGIPPEYQDKVFLIFQRLHDRTKFEGSGIGLTICKKIVQNHGGEIWLESQEGTGTTVFFTLDKIPACLSEKQVRQPAYTAA